MTTMTATSQPPNRSAKAAAAVLPRPGEAGCSSERAGPMPARPSTGTLMDALSSRTRSVLEALADLLEIFFGHQLGTGVEIGRGDATVDLQIELHHRPESLQEGLLAERAAQVALFDLLALGRPEIEAEGADLATGLELADRIAEP